MRYTFADRLPIFKNGHKADPQRIGEALQRIAENGILTPRAVVDAARKSTHPLHPHFDWDDKHAAELHRLNQARMIIAMIRIKEPRSKPTPAYISVGSKGSGRSYQEVKKVFSSSALTVIAIRDIERQIESLMKRLEDLKALKDIAKQLRPIREEIAKRRVEQENHTSA
jgi:hypothetical protein